MVTDPDFAARPLSSRRGLLKAASYALAATAIGASSRQVFAQEPLTPEMFGAVGDGRINDTAAFGRLAAAVTKQGGGRIALAPKVYLVGAQRKTGALDRVYSYAPERLLEFDGLEHGLVIEGNGATLRCAPGLRFGSFDPATGEPHQHDMPFFDRSTMATPYRYMIAVARTKGFVRISNLELDGNLRKLKLGSGYGDTGIQIAGSGIFLHDNLGDEILENIHSHHHPQDGLMIGGLDDADLAAHVTRRAYRVRCEFNARQGCSLIGGRNWSFERSMFNHTGRGGLASAPAAGFDMEAEGGKINRAHRFIDCEFVDNTGCGMVADSGDSAQARFTRCRFVGTSNWSVWSAKPGFRFEQCLVVGTAVRPFGDPDPARATQFTDCTFTDDPALSSAGQVFRENRADGSLFNLGHQRNVLFDRCWMEGTAGAVLPWSTGAIYRDCTMRQGWNATGHPRGTYEGHTLIAGKANLTGSVVNGSVILNGKHYAA